MADDYETELTEEEHEALVAISEHAIAAPLSSAASAVINAALAVQDEWDSIPMVAAAIRAAALYCKRDRLLLLAIADELDGIANA